MLPTNHDVCWSGQAACQRGDSYFQGYLHCRCPHPRAWKQGEGDKKQLWSNEEYRLSASIHEVPNKDFQCWCCTVKNKCFTKLLSFNEVLNILLLTISKIIQS